MIESMPGHENIWYILLALVTAICSLACNRGIRRTFSRFRSRERKAGKELIYRHFPRRKKPLGGGVAIFGALLAGVAFSWLLARFRLIPPVPWLQLLAWLGCGIAFGAIGLIDDWRKVNAARGLREGVKLLLQVLFAGLFTLLIVTLGTASALPSTTVFLPFIGWVALGYLYLPFGMLVLVGASNAVNLTDGLDGLAGSSLAITFLGYLLLGALLHYEGIPILIPLLALGALAGFLFYNRPPARIIMGDTGALGLGAALGALALMTHTEWLLLLFAAPFIIDTVSVLIQVSVIKFFRGPVKLLRHQTTEIVRPFLCTPLHHHFQWLAWGPWPILALFDSVALFSVALALLAMPAAAVGPAGLSWFWLGGLVLQGIFLAFASAQKSVRANYFLGLERVDGAGERMLSLYKGLPIEFFGVRWYSIEDITGITETMINTIAAESILWRNISEIEARATLGKIYVEYRLVDRAAEEWEVIPLRNLLIRENLVVQLGKIYFGRDELLRAIKLWEQLPQARLTRIPGLPETIRSAKVRVGHLAGRLYHQAREHAAALEARRAVPPSPAEIAALVSELEGALRYTQDLRDLLSYEQQKAEGEGELDGRDGVPDLYRRMDATLTARREELHTALRWAQGLLEPIDDLTAAPGTLQQLAEALQMTPPEISRALNLKGLLPVLNFARIQKPSRNNLYRVTLDAGDMGLPGQFIAKCFQESQITFFSACYRRERGVLQLLQETNAPVPRLLGGYLGARQGVLFLEDLGNQDLGQALLAISPEDRHARITLVHRGLETLVEMHVHTLPALDQLEREIAKIVKEVLTPEYYVNTTTIALNRILALEGRQLTAGERGRLDVALRPLIVPLLDEPKTFIHFEYTPGNLHLAGGRVVAVDFEQSTMGPAAFDLATLLYSPEADLRDEEIDGLLKFFSELLPATSSSFRVHQETLEAAAIFKLLFYAGSAANFYRKFEEGSRLSAMEWYLHTAERLLAHSPDYDDLAHTLRQCWHGQRHLPV